MLAEHGVDAAPGALAESIRLGGTARIDTLPGFQEGLFSVQDESAMLAIDRLAAQPGETILDLCAAPGTKTTHIAERMHNQGSIIATDIRAERLARVAENCIRLGISIVHPILIPESPDVASNGASALELCSGPFDAILVDVPCSNTGVLGKRPEARWRITQTDIEELAAQQLRLLESACRRLRPGGRLLYSTCSIEPEENEQIVRTVLRREQTLSLVGEWHQVPGRLGDGGYQALLIRVESPRLGDSLGKPAAAAEE
jgi:16S rRNA (cytosine967-C5)-methyltransferase